jgi:hypothetical protein
MSDHAVIDIDRAFDLEDVAGRNAGDKRLVAGDRLFDVAGLADAGRHGRFQRLEE